VTSTQESTHDTSGSSFLWEKTYFVERKDSVAVAKKEQCAGLRTVNLEEFHTGGKGKGVFIERDIRVFLALGGRKTYLLMRRGEVEHVGAGVKKERRKMRGLVLRSVRSLFPEKGLLNRI